MLTVDPFPIRNKSIEEKKGKPMKRRAQTKIISHHLKVKKFFALESNHDQVSFPETHHKGSINWEFRKPAPKDKPN